MKQYLYLFQWLTRKNKISAVMPRFLEIRHTILSHRFIGCGLLNLRKVSFPLSKMVNSLSMWLALQIQKSLSLFFFFFGFNALISKYQQWCAPFLNYTHTLTHSYIPKNEIKLGSKLTKKVDQPKHQQGQRAPSCLTPSHWSGKVRRSPSRGRKQGIREGFEQRTFLKFVCKHFCENGID